MNALRSSLSLLVCVIGLLAATVPLAPPFPLRSQSSIEDSATASDRAIAKALTWLRLQQADDGGWHSETYGSMRCGAGNTALILDALSRLPARHRGKCTDMERGAVDFLLQNLDASGCVRGTDGVVDFPAYASALTLSALHRIDPEQHHEPIARMAGFLLKAQSLPSAEDESILPGHGGWGPTSGVDPPEIAIARTNLSVTRHVLEALAESRKLTANAREAAIAYILRCRAGNAVSADVAGFCFSPHANDPLNKAGYFSPHDPRPYKPPTCDGIRALLACGVDLADAQIREPAHWLESHQQRASVLEPPDDAVDWEEALWFYHAATFSTVTGELHSPARRERQRKSIDMLLTRQQSRGCWENPDGRMREDDPLIATALALITLSNAIE